MREIKFRAWNTDYKEMWKWKDVKQSTHFKLLEEAKNIIFLQYTGLKDKNGVEIYEGDIIKGRNHLFENQVTVQKVTFLNGCFMFGNWNAHEYFNKHTEIEVIGNIYENPELLEGKE